MRRRNRNLISTLVYSCKRNIRKKNDQKKTSLFRCYLYVVSTFWCLLKKYVYLIKFNAEVLSEPSQTSKIEPFAKIVLTGESGYNYFCKKIHLRCLSGA